jgi:hypothetical protein
VGLHALPDNYVHGSLDLSASVPGDLSYYVESLTITQTQNMKIGMLSSGNAWQKFN